MPNSEFPSPKLSLAFAKIVANPTANSWSQVYNAGSFFAALSLTIIDKEAEEIVLPAAGKELFNNLETEFFTLEDKKLQTIKAAIEKSFSAVRPEIRADACLAYFKDDILYIFIKGRGKIIMKRDEKSGTLLEKKNEDEQILTASGYLSVGDVILLQTDRFEQNVSQANIKQALELQLPSDIAESLSPYVHEKEDGGQAAIIIAYNGGVKKQQPLPVEENLQEAEEPERTDAVIEPEAGAKQQGAAPSPKFKVKLKLPAIHLTKIQKIALGAGVIILVLLIGGIMFTKINQENNKLGQLYAQVAAQAQKNINEGQALSKLNQELAADSFAKAEQILTDNMGKFKAGSKEEAALQVLLSQVKKEVDVKAPVNKTEAKIAKVDEGDMLNIEKENKADSYANDSSFVYLLSSKGVNSIDKNGGAKKEIIKNDGDWSAGVAIAVYQGNVYILDRKSGVLKYVAGAGGFGKSDYFKSAPSELGDGQSMSIDGSIWILTRGGKIFKYTRGVADDFNMSGMDKPFSSPTKIFTSVDIDNIYILDRGNSRIVKLGKSGNYQNQVSADVLKDAQDFEIDDKEQNAFVLSGGKIYELAL